MEIVVKNLNNLSGYFKTGIGHNNERGYNFKLRNHQGCDNNSKVEVFFDGAEERLLELIEQYEVVVGCVAWFTNFKVLNALTKCDWVSIVVQKEDFLRNDTSISHKTWARNLREAYTKLNGKDGYSMNIPDIYVDHPHFNRRVQECCVTADGQWIHAMNTVRCIGYGSKDKNITPKMHHKFLVFGSKDEEVDIVPKAVWTGSYNITKNAEKSRENVLIIHSKEIVHSYLSEWAQLWVLSEYLDWSCIEPNRPEVYVGT